MAQLTGRGATKVRLLTDKKEHVLYIQRRYFSIFLRLRCEGWTELSLFYTVGFQKSYWDKRTKSEASLAPVGNLRRNCLLKTAEREMFHFVTLRCNGWTSYPQKKKMLTPWRSKLWSGMGWFSRILQLRLFPFLNNNKSIKIISKIPSHAHFRSSPPTHFLFIFTLIQMTLADVTHVALWQFSLSLSRLVSLFSCQTSPWDISRAKDLFFFFFLTQQLLFCVRH